MSAGLGLIASLPMYDLPEVRPANTAIWKAVRDRLRDAGMANVPDELERDGNVERHWSSERLLFSQTCGYPLTHAYDGKLQLLATPLYAVPGCVDANYRSFIVVAEQDAFRKPADLAGRRAAYNTDDSMSGMLVLKSVFAPHSSAGRFFGDVICSGGHARSMQMVADGAADVAAIDCVTYALLQRHRPQLTGRLRIIAEGPLAPSLPFVTSPGMASQQVDMLRQALVSVIADPTFRQAREQLFLSGVAVLQRSDYERILDIEREADALGYRTLA